MRTSIAIAATISFLNSIYSPAHAELGKLEMDALKPLLGTTSVRYVPVTTRGELVACSLEYNASALDTHNKQGQPVVIVGNISVGVSNGKVAGSLKVIVNDFISIVPTIKMQPSVPAFIYLQTAGGVNNSKSIVKRFPSDTPGGLVAVFPTDDRFFQIVADMIMKDEIIVVFNRTESGLDVRVPIDISIADTVVENGVVNTKRAADTGEKFIECLERLGQ